MNLKGKSKFVSFLKAALFLGACLAVSFAVVFPLWAFAKNAPKAYSATVLIAAALIAAWKLAAWTKKSGAKNALRIVLKCAVAAAGFFFAFNFLLSFRRILALAAAVLTIALFKLVDVAFKKA